MRSFLLKTMGLWALALLAAFGCREASFGGANNTKEPSKNEAPKPNKEQLRTEKGDEPAGPMSPDQNPALQHCKSSPSSSDQDEEEKQRQDAFIRKASSCLNNSKFFDYQSRRCLDLHHPKKFTCTWEGVLKRLKSLKLSTDELEPYAKSHDLLGCAESRDGQRVMTQSISKKDIKKLDCTGESPPGNMLLATCFTVDKTSENEGLDEPSSQKEHLRVVERCYKEEAE